MVPNIATLGDEEGPAVDEVDAVQHHQDQAVPVLEATRLGVFEEEGVTEDVAATLVPEHGRTLPAGADLAAETPDAGVPQHGVQLLLVRAVLADVADV